MKRISILLLVAFMSMGVCAQQYTRGNISMGLTVSLNSTRLLNDTVHYNRTLLPGAGVDFYSSLSKSLKINFGAQVSMKGTNDFDTLGDLRGFYLEPHIALQFIPIKKLRLEGGVQYSHVVAGRTITLAGDASSGTKWHDYQGLRSPMEYFVGLHAELDRRVHFGLRYYIPHKKTEFNRLEIRAIILMIEGYTKR